MNEISPISDKTIELFRLSTVGDVDSGKSTLIGRLLYDSKSLFDDQLEAIKRINNSYETLDLAKVTDGLREERLRGITIDVAYRYFSTPKRKFILADTPGHVEYTRNMITGASTADACLILIDAEKGIEEQTKRHTFITALLRIPNLLICVNKMDAVGFSEDKFIKLKKDFQDISQKIDLQRVDFIPVSALLGDNIVEKSSKMPWYNGNTLLELLEDLPTKNKSENTFFRLPVQSILKKDGSTFIAGRIVGGKLSLQNEICNASTLQKSLVKRIFFDEKEVVEAHSMQSIMVELTSEMKVQRGDILTFPQELPTISNKITAKLCWLNELPMNLSQNYILLHACKEITVKIQFIHYRLDIQSFSPIKDKKPFSMNELGEVSLLCDEVLVFDSFRDNETMGSFILIDKTTNETVAAGII